MSAREVQEWMIRSRKLNKPLPDHAFFTALTCQTTANVHGNRTKVADFMPRVVDAKRSTGERSPEENYYRFRLATAAREKRNDDGSRIGERGG